jgi:hypothetical protein
VKCVRRPLMTCRKHHILPFVSGGRAAKPVDLEEDRSRQMDSDAGYANTENTTLGRNIVDTS